MADTDDALKHFISSTTDNPYTLLDLPNGPASTEKEIRSAWKRTALKFHPDKIRASDIDEATANRLYILRQDAYGILSEPLLKEQYDNALRAREAKRVRDEALGGERRRMKEELERREGLAMGKRKREDDEGEMLEREIARVRLDGQRRRRERAEMLRREAEEEEKGEREVQERGALGEGQFQEGANGPVEIKEIDRVVKTRYPQNEKTAHVTGERIKALFSRFGAVEGVTLREKKVKVDGEKHRRVFVTASVIFESIIAAHAAVSDLSGVAKREGGDWQFLESPEWASGQEPEAIHRPQQQSRPPSTTTATNDTPSLAANADDILMIRLKNAEKKRREDKKRKEEEAAAAAAAAAQRNGDDVEADKPPKKPMPSFNSFKASKILVDSASNDTEKRKESEKRRLEEEMRREEEEEERREAERVDA